jgi:hypothetical protein
VDKPPGADRVEIEKSVPVYRDCSSGDLGSETALPVARRIEFHDACEARISNKDIPKGIDCYVPGLPKRVLTMAHYSEHKITFAIQLVNRALNGIRDIQISLSIAPELP